MFIVLVTYTKPLEEIDRLLPEHREFLMRNYDNGTFLLSGRQEPRTGGVILAKAASPEDILRIIEEDPFFREKAAEYRIIEFIPTMAAEYLTEFKVDF